jgi:serine/threonine protein kinase
MIGEGSVGEDYEAEDFKFGRQVALRLLPDALVNDRHAIRRLRSEVHAASALDHPNIRKVYEIGEVGGWGFIAMEMLRGQTLRQQIKGNPLQIETVLDLGTQFADALDAAHSRGIIHRDINPANMFVTDRGQAKIVDFGLAEVLPTSEGPAGSTPAISSEPYLTSPGATIGALAYMSPEQIRGEELDARTDLFSYGTVLYEMATGASPFRGDTSAAIFESILNLMPVPASRLNPKVPPQLSEIINKALAKDRNLRYQTAGEIRNDLGRVREDIDTLSTNMSGALQPPTPIVIHPRSETEVFKKQRRSNIFYCLDSVEFGAEWSRTVAAIRNDAGFAVPIIVVGSVTGERRQVHEEAKKVAEAGAVYFERPAGGLKIDDLANEISRKLSRVSDLLEPFSQPRYPQSTTAAEQDDDHVFYADAPFRLPQSALKQLLTRLKMNDSNPQKDD